MATKKATKHFVWKAFSKKQLKAMTWWIPPDPANGFKGSKYHDFDMFIADGSIRSGKTISVLDSFITWSLETFEHEQFGIAGKSVRAIRQNVLRPMFEILTAKGIAYDYNKSENIVTVGTNQYVIYGAPNESSQDVLQGSTLAGGLIDEIALVPYSFVDQFIGRCSVEGNKIFATCNPRGPYHWLKTDFIDKRKEKKICYLHFTMDDNPALAESTRDKYKRMYSGVFYKRNVLGMWVLSEGLIFDMFDEDQHTVNDQDIPRMKRHWIAIDQGQANATVFLHQALGEDGRLYTLDEYYHSGRDKVLYINGQKKPTGHFQKAPSEYAKDLKDFIDGLVDHAGRPVNIEKIYIDPASKGFITQVYQAKIVKTSMIAKADNAVSDGIDFIASLITMDHYRIHDRCVMTKKGFSTYVWDEKAQERGDEKPVKKDDDTMDANRYGGYSSKKYFKDVFKEAVA